MVVFDVQRAGPSTGMPTKTEQSDLLMAMYGRHGECSAGRAGRGHAGRLLRHGLRGGSPGHQVHDAGDGAFRQLPGQRRRAVADRRSRRAARSAHAGDAFARDEFAPYRRDPQDAGPALGRRPARPGCEHRIGGLEKEDVTGAVSYDAANHQRMVELRAEKIERHRPRHSAGRGPGRARANCWWWLGQHLRCRWPPPSSELAGGGPLGRPPAPALPESLPGQSGRGAQAVPADPRARRTTWASSARLLRDRYLVDARPLAKVEGRPFRVSELSEQICDFAGRTSK